MKILIAVDGSEYTKHMLAYLGAHDEWFDGRNEYTVVHVVPALPPHAAASLGKESCQSWYDDEAEKVFGPIRRFFLQNSIAATYVPQVGHVAEIISTVAQDGRFGLLMLGSHGHGSLVGLVLGSVATKVLASCKTPVLILR